MSEPSPHQREDGPPRPDPTASPIRACETCPGKHVFLEGGNTDGWIATDLVVDLDR